MCVEEHMRIKTIQNAPSKKFMCWAVLILNYPNCYDRHQCVKQLIDYLKTGQTEKSSGSNSVEYIYIYIIR